MGLFDKIIPGRRVQLDKEEIERTNDRKIETIIERTERLERLWFVDDVFPKPERRINGNVRA